MSLSRDTQLQARAALARASAEAAAMPGNLLPFDCLDDLIVAGRRIAAEVEALSAADLTGPARLEQPLAATVAGLLLARHLFGERAARVQLGLGLFLQDIGKLALPPAIAHKPGPLAADEWELMSRHPQLGMGFLRDERIGDPARAVVRWHHERWDGGGYPDGLAGGEIPIAARVAAVAGAVTDPHELHSQAGRRFDPALVELCLERGPVAAPALARAA